jgi:hypothetical protein
MYTQGTPIVKKSFSLEPQENIDKDVRRFRHKLNIGWAGHEFKCLMPTSMLLSFVRDQSRQAKNLLHNKQDSELVKCPLFKGTVA